MKFHNDTGVLVRRKGGNVPGYTALLAFVPELELSLSILWSGAADEFTWSIHAFDLILPPWLDMMHNLLETKPQTQPKNASQFVGDWTSTGGLPAKIFQYNDMLLIKVLGLGMYMRIPNWKQEQNDTMDLIYLQMWVQRNVAPCLTLELQAMINQYVIFDQQLSSFTIPGYVPGIKWVRTSS